MWQGRAEIDIPQKLYTLAQGRFKSRAVDLAPCTALNTLGDSLDFVDFLAEVEAAFDIDLGNERIAQIRTVGDLTAAVEEALGAVSRPA